MPTAIIRIIMNMPIDNIALLRLMHLVSPSLPVGSYSYSQGLEWAVEDGWVTDGSSLHAWLESILHTSLRPVDVPLINLMYGAYADGNYARIEELTAVVLACRETKELREEEIQKGRALCPLLDTFGFRGQEEKTLACRSFLGGYAFAAYHWKVPCRDAVKGYLWSWLENQVLGGIKIIPLGQTEGQKILDQLIPLLPEIAAAGKTIRPQDIGGSATALSIGSMLHETQYTRLYRS